MTRAASVLRRTASRAVAPECRFDRAVFALVRRVPPGRIVTYGQLAALLGAPRAARAVGWAMRRCPPGIPWHRVLNGRGGISLRANAPGMLTQRLLLEREGVGFARGRVDLARYRWRTRPDRSVHDLPALGRL